MKKLQFAAHLFILIISFIFSSIVSAEGTFQFGGDSANQPLEKSTRVFIHVTNPNDYIRVNLCANGSSNSGDVNAGVQATIYGTSVNANGKYIANSTPIVTLSSPKGQISCSHSMTTPLPATPAISGANTMQHQISNAGVYAININAGAGNEFRRWDFSVASSSTADVDPTDNAGNLFAYDWGVFTHSFADAFSITSQMYILVPGGYPNTNYVWQLDLQDFSGNQFNLVANNIGVNAPNSGFSVPTSGNTLTDQYPIYLAYPAGANPSPEPVQTPSLTQSLVFTDSEGNDSVISPDGDSIEDSGIFSFTPDVTGTYSLVVDLNNDGQYGTGNDKIILGRMTANQSSSVIWDGTDFNNATAADGTYNVQLQLRIGEYHFVAEDAETSGGNNDGANDGLTILKAIDATTVEGIQIYWNDNAIGGSSNLPDGVLSSTAANGAHRHTWGSFVSSGIGDKTFIDTYVFGKTVPISVTATVASVNTPPSISDHSLSINENTGIGGSAGNVVASDSDGDSLSYLITAGNAEGLYSLHSATGEITSTINLDYETNTLATVLTIQINDGTEVNNAQVTINLQDLNETPTISGTPLTSVAEDSAYSFTPTGSDPDGDSISYSVANLPSWASFNTSTGGITGTPTNIDVGSHSNIVITVTDGLLSSSLATFSITVTNTNDAPVISGSPATTIAEDSAYSFAPSASDPDGDSLTFSVVNLPSWASFNTSTGAITGTPVDSDVGVYPNIVITVSDSLSTDSLTAFTITVTNTNDAPVISGSPTTTVAEDSAYSFIPTASDPDGDSLTYSVANLPSWASFSTSTGAITGTPTNDDVGSHANIVITVTDGILSSSLTAFSITVTNINDAPVISGSPATTIAEDSAYGFTPTASDLDGDSLTFSVVNLPSWASFNTSTGAITGTPTNIDVGSFSNIVITVSDGSLSSSLTAFSITVINTNDAPTAVDDVASTNEDTPVTFAVLTNDTDPENDTLTVTAASALNGTVVINAATTLSYTPNADFNGNDTITYAIQDGNGGSDTGAVAITVNPINDAPVAVDDSATTNEDSAVSINVLTNDSDIENDSLSVSATTAANGALVVNVDKTISYTPNADYNGSETFTYSINDGNGGADSATVTVIVNAVNDAPIANTDSSSTNEDTTIAINVLANDTDVDLDPLTVTSATAINGSIVINLDGTISYTPSPNFNGVDTINYSISDGKGGTDNSTVSVTITAINDAPIATDDAATTEQDMAVIINVLANDSDADGDGLSVTAASATNGTITINPDETINYTPNSGFWGADSINYSITDGQGGSDSANVSVTVTARALSISGTADTSILEAQDYLFIPTTTSFAGDTLTFSITNLPSWATFDPTTGTISGTPAHTDVGVYSDIVICVTNGTHTECLPAFSVTVISDLDQDGIPDTEDDDIDGDGMSNDFEEEHGLDPYDDSDANIDTDGDGVLNIDEFYNDTDPNVDDYAPELMIPDDVWVDATELFNLVDIGTHQAFDYVDSERVACCENATTNAPQRFEPGTTEVIWTVADPAGNEATATQLIHVRPLISFSPDFDLAEGSEYVVSIHLNGESPEYPLDVPYNITGGSASPDDDYIWASGVATFTQGTRIDLPITIVADDIVENDETITAEIGDSVNRGAKYTLTINIKEENLAPQATLSVMQNNTIGLQVSLDGGMVTVSSNIFDPNTIDTHSYDWSQSNNMLVNESSEQSTFSFDPNNLALGGYRIVLTVTDSGTPALNDTVISNLTVIETPSEEEENTVSCNLAKEVGSVEDAFIVETEAGVCISKGLYSLSSINNGIWLTDTDFELQSGLVPDELVNAGGRFDFTITELNTAQVAVVIPQRSALLIDSAYRVYINGQWKDFDLSNGDRVMSAPGAAGFCPPPATTNFVNGLVAGSHCVMLLITDGGTNDSDGLANGIIDSTSGAHLMLAVEIVTRGGGSGSIHWLFILALVGFATKRRQLTQFAQ